MNKNCYWQKDIDDENVKSTLHYQNDNEVKTSLFFVARSR